MDNPHISSAQWAELSNQQICKLFNETFADVSIKPNNALVIELRQLGTATLELVENRTASSVYRIRDNGVVYQIEMYEGTYWEYDSYEDYLDEDAFDKLITKHDTPQRTYIVYEVGDDLFVERTKPPRFKARYTPGGIDGDIQLLEFKDPVKSIEETAKLMKQASGSVARHLKNKRHG